MDEVGDLGGNPVLRMDKSNPDRPFLTDQRNYLVDCDFGLIADARGLATTLKEISGVVEHGLFLGLARAALIADGKEIMILRPHYPPMPLGQCDLALE
jgi:ribose 5-phosphate isomerase A